MHAKIVAYGVRGEGLVWLIGAVLCLLAATASAIFGHPVRRRVKMMLTSCELVVQRNTAKFTEVIKVHCVFYSGHVLRF